MTKCIWYLIGLGIFMGVFNLAVLVSVILSGHSGRWEEDKDDD